MVYLGILVIMAVVFALLKTNPWITRVYVVFGFVIVAMYADFVRRGVILGGTDEKPSFRALSSSGQEGGRGGGGVFFYGGGK